MAVLAGLLQTPPFRARTDLVAVNVTVLDDKGMPLPRLGEDAFTMTEDGIPQRIAHSRAATSRSASSSRPTAASA